MVNNLQGAFDKATKKYFDHYSSEEESCYPDSKTTVFREKHFNKSNSAKSSTAIDINPKELIIEKKDNKNNKGKGGNKNSEIKNNNDNNDKNEKQHNDKNNDSKGGNKRKRKDKDKRRKKKIKLNSNKNKSSEGNSSDDEDEDDDNDNNDDDNEDKKNSRLYKEIEEESNDNEESSENDNDDDDNDDSEIEGNPVKQKSRKGKETSKMLTKQQKASLTKTNAAATKKNQKNQSKSLKSKSNLKKIQEDKNNELESKKQNKSKNNENRKSIKKGSAKVVEEEIDSDAEDILRTKFNNDDKDSEKDCKNDKKGKNLATKNMKKPSSTNASKNKNNNSKIKQEEENQNERLKSKINKEDNSSKKNLSLPSSSSQVKDNKSARSRSANTNKKNKKQNKSNKKNGATQYKNKQQQQQKSAKLSDDNEVDNNEENDDFDSISRSSSPLYKVDLHKKYAQSASMNFEDELLYSSTENHEYNNKRNYSASIDKSGKNSHHHYRRNNDDAYDDMLMSVSSQSSSSSRSPTPTTIITSQLLSPIPPPLKDTDKNNERKEKEKKKKKAETKSIAKKLNKKSESKKKKSIISENPSPPNSPSPAPSPPPTDKFVESSVDEQIQKEIPLFLDKYDLIKQRRNRSTATISSSTTTTTDEKWNQIVKEAEKIKDTKKYSKPNSGSGSSGATLTTSKEKNQKLKETIEKLKMKNAKSKESAVLIDQIFGVKPATHEIRDEQAILQKLRETCLDGNSAAATATTTAKAHTIVASSTPSAVLPSTSNTTIASTSDTNNKRSSSMEHHQHKNRKRSGSSSSGSNKRNRSPSKKKERNRHHRHEKSRINTNKKSSTKRISSKKNSKSKENNTKDTNMEALELETEQTLKDINRWLEHAPRFPDYGSASSSPSRFNIALDDLVQPKIDPSDCSRPPAEAVPVPVPLPITTKNSSSSSITPNDTFDEFATTNTSTVVESSKKDDMISNLITAANVVNSEEQNKSILPLSSLSQPSSSTSIVNNNTGPSHHHSSSSVQNSLSTSTNVRTTANTTQLLPHPPPPPPHIKSQQQKEAKRKSLKEKLQAAVSGHYKRKDHPLRTIDRLQPGKSKGNLLSNTHHHSSNKSSDEIFPLGASAKIKEVKNSLLVKTDEAAPKLSLGSVLNTEGFGLGQLHSFETDCGSSSNQRLSEVIDSERSTATATVTPVVDRGDELGSSSAVTSEKNESSGESSGASSSGNATYSSSERKSDQEKLQSTPNLSAWFKAFGGPKLAKKLEEVEKKNENSSTETAIQQNSNNNSDNNLENNITSEETTSASLSMTPATVTTSNTFNTMKSPPATSNVMENFSLPAPRTRKASTGSTVSERSSFSQDPDSPRVGIDDRFGGYPGPYSSPLGASPIMVSPKPDEIGKPTSPYPLNGAIKVGFYQDTTTKSSPEKSCSPRELPSPAAYPQYSQHVYSSASSPTVSGDMSTNGTSSYGASCYNTSNNNSDMNKTAGIYSNVSSMALYEQYKQPHSHESEYNSSMSPSTNPNSPYQQSSQNSPYHHQNSPYHQTQNSPYHQSQNSPFQAQTNNATTPVTPVAPLMIPSNKSPVASHQQQQSPQQGPHSPYQQSINSPYQQSNNSPYNQQQQQNASSPYHTQSSPQMQSQAQQQQQQVNMNFNQATPEHQTTPINSPQQPPSDSPFSSTESPQYQIHDSPQFQQPSDQQPAFESEMGKDSMGTKSSSMGNKLQQNQPEWNNDTASLTELSPMVSPQRQQQQSVHDSSSTTALQYHQNYPQYPITSKTSDNSNHQHQQDHSQVSPAGIKRMATHSNESDVLGLSSYTNSTDSQPPPNKQQKCDANKSFDSTLNKHQQMFDSFLGSMGGSGKGNLGFGKPPLDISTSKAFEMFNKAATYGLSKEFQQNNIYINTHKIGDAASNNSSMGSGKSILNSSFNQEQITLEPSKLQQNNLYDPKLNNQVSAYSNASANEMIDPSARPDQQQHLPDINRNQPLNMDYKQSYNTPASAMLEPLRNLNHPLSMIDENILNLQNVSSTGFYDKNIPPVAHVYNKGLSVSQNYLHQNVSPYDTRDQQNSTAATASYISPSVTVANNTNIASITQQPQQQIQEVIEQKPKRGRKKKNATTSIPVDTSNVANSQARNQIMTATATVATQPPQIQSQALTPNVAIGAPPNAAIPSQSIHDHQQQQQQGFQLYAGLKTTAVSNASVSTDSSALKSATTAASMVPGSAFNFGPSPAGLGIPPAGIYGDQTGYLDEFRSAHNPYYPIPTGHRPEISNEKSSNAPPPPPGPPTPSTYHQFLTHSSSRASYTFMNSPQLDPNSPIYQQYIQRQLMLNQGLLGPAPTAGYPQASYRPPIGMPKHYDMNRQWF